MFMISLVDHGSNGSGGESERSTVFCFRATVSWEGADL